MGATFFLATTEAAMKRDWKFKIRANFFIFCVTGEWNMKIN
jgi:hypothetical protein